MHSFIRKRQSMRILYIFHQVKTINAQIIYLSSGKDNPCSDYISFIRKRQSMLRLYIFHQEKTIHAQIIYLSSGKDNPYSDWACLPLLDSLTEFGRKLESLCPSVCLCLSVGLCLSVLLSHMSRLSPEVAQNFVTRLAMVMHDCEPEYDRGKNWLTGIILWPGLA